MNDSSTFAQFQPGVVLGGKYRVERVIGQGGMGIVAAVFHVHLEQRMALKLMLPHAMMSGEAVSRFVREARAAARISSEHVARVFDVGTLDTGEPYIAMEYLEGSDIAQLLAQGRLPYEQAIEYLLQACEALAEAHSAGIVHRDLKPGNLFLVQRLDGQRLVKVLDFGISKMSGGSAQSNAPATRTSALMGSPLYMSPEQMGSSKAVDARSDIWALGVVLYEMLSGAPPFNGDTLPQVCGMVMSEPPPPLVECAPGLPPLLYQVVTRCLEKQPAARFQSVAELAHALEPLASPRARQSVERISRVQGVVRPEEPTTASLQPVTGNATQAVTGPNQGTYAPWGETKPPLEPRRSAAPFVAAGVVVLGLAGAGGWFALRSTTATSTTAPLASAAPATSAVTERVGASAAAPASTEPPPVAPLAPLAPSATPDVAPSASATSSSKPSGAKGSSAKVVPPGAKQPRPIPAPPPAATPAAPAAASPTPATPATPPPVSTRSRL